MAWFSFFKKKQELRPESKWIVEIENGTLTSIDYKKVERKITLNSIHKITIETNDSGPWGTDLWWVIFSNEAPIHIPNGATGESSMLERFQKINGFNNEKLIEAMSSTHNATFICLDI